VDLLRLCVVILVIKVCIDTLLSATFPKVCCVVQVSHLLSRFAATKSRDSGNGPQWCEGNHIGNWWWG